MDNEFISAIEKLNAEDICLLLNKKKDLTKINIKDIFCSLRSRFLFKHIKQAFSNENLPIDEQNQLARLGRNDIRVVVYTCITGTYDILKSPLLKSENTKFVLFSDSVKQDGWTWQKIPDDVVEKYSQSMQNRYLKFHPFELFSNEFDYSVYIDGNIMPISDLSVMCEQISNQYGIAFHAHCSRNCIYEEVKACIALRKGNKKGLLQQIQRYKNEGFPKEYGMVEGNVIVVDLKNQKAKKLLSECWDELIKSESGRDQIAWPYVMWINNIQPNQLSNLGKNVYKNPKLRISRHV